MNKTDSLSCHRIGDLTAILQKLNPKAKLIESKFSKVDLADVLNTGRFDFDEVSQSTDWIQELQNRKDGKVHTPETEKY